MFTLTVKIADVRDRLGWTVKVEMRRNDSSDHVLKIADRLGCLGSGVPTGRDNPRRRKIVKIPILTILRTSGIRL